MTSLKLVVDTNILISAALSTQGSPARLVQKVLTDHRLVFSQPTFDELRTRLYRPKFDRYISLETRERLLHDFNACAHWVDIGEPKTYSRDRDDDKFIETALVAQAPYLISGDNDLLDVPPLANVQIISVLQALSVVGL